MTDSRRVSRHVEARRGVQQGRANEPLRLVEKGEVCARRLVETWQTGGEEGRATTEQRRARARTRARARAMAMAMAERWVVRLDGRFKGGTLNGGRVSEMGGGGHYRPQA